MKVLIIQEAGRNPPNAHMRECFAIKRAFEQNGWLADVWGLGHANFKSIPVYEEYDLIFCLENYSIGWLPDFAKIRGPKKCHWIIDLHCAGTDYQSLSRKCDYVLHSTRSLMPEYAKHNSAHNIWLPNGVDDQHFYVRNITKEQKARFVATAHYGRREFANYVGAEFKTLLGQEMIDCISSSLIHFNKSLSCDVNYRCWETVGLGTALVTNYFPEMEQIGFRHGTNCFMYMDHLEAREYVHYLLEYPKAAIKLGQEGAEFAKQNTYTIRVKNLLEQIFPATPN